MLAWKVAPALAMGNTVVLKPAEYTSLTALLFADLCRAGGGAAGRRSTSSPATARWARWSSAAEVDKIAFTGSTAVGRRIREATAGTGKSLTLELGGKSPYIVFDDADLDSRRRGAGGRDLVQPGPGLLRRLAPPRAGGRGRRLPRASSRRRMDRLAHRRPARQGDRRRRRGRPGAARRHHPRWSTPTPRASATSPPCPIPARAASTRRRSSPASRPPRPLMQEEIFGPVLVATTFRTPAEAVELANNTRYGLAATLWTENVNLALDVAPKLAAGVVWVNAHQPVRRGRPLRRRARERASAARAAGRASTAYTTPAARARASRSSPSRPSPARARRSTALDRTAKLYVGGKQARPDGGYSRAVWAPKGALLGHASLANRKDVRNAVEAANAARVLGPHHGPRPRPDPLLPGREPLRPRRRVRPPHRRPDRPGRARPRSRPRSDRLFRCGRLGRQGRRPRRGRAVPRRGARHERAGGHHRRPLPRRGAAPRPRGAAGARRIAMGNRVVLVASEPFPLAATDFYQVLETSDVPGGVVNILTGSHAELAPTLAAPPRRRRGLVLLGPAARRGHRGEVGRQPQAHLGRDPRPRLDMPATAPAPGDRGEDDLDPLRRGLTSRPCQRGAGPTNIAMPRPAT